MQITNQRELLAMIEQIEGCRALAIDTEFMRDKTYYPMLCLVQLATDDAEFIVDPLAVRNLKPLGHILGDARTVKIFHAGGQDRDLLYHYCGTAAAPVFDTQSAAPLLGMPQQVGYATAVQELCGVRLKKLDSMTDWSLRPLSGRQIDYSLDDVRYLIPMYDKMRERLEKAGRLAWLDGEFAAMADPSRFETDEADLWQKVKKASSLKGRQLKHAADIAIWRERIAKTRNIPRRWVLSDELVVELSRVEPKTVDELYRIRGTREKLTPAMAKELLHIIETGKNADPSTWPTRTKRGHSVAGSDALADTMMGLVRMRAKENRIAPQVIAVHDELMALANGTREGLDLLTGWRYDIAGRELLEFLDGRVSLRVVGGRLTATPVDAIEIDAGAAESAVTGDDAPDENA